MGFSSRPTTPGLRLVRRLPDRIRQDLTACSIFGRLSWLNGDSSALLTIGPDRCNGKVIANHRHSIELNFLAHYRVWPRIKLNPVPSTIFTNKYSAHPGVLSDAFIATPWSLGRRRLSLFDTLAHLTWRCHR